MVSELYYLYELQTPQSRTAVTEAKLKAFLLEMEMCFLSSWNLQSNSAVWIWIEQNADQFHPGLS